MSRLPRSAGKLETTPGSVSRPTGPARRAAGARRPARRPPTTRGAPACPIHPVMSPLHRSARQTRHDRKIGPRARAGPPRTHTATRQPPRRPAAPRRAALNRRCTRVASPPPPRCAGLTGAAPAWRARRRRVAPALRALHARGEPAAAVLRRPYGRCMRVAGPPPPRCAGLTGAAPAWRARRCRVAPALRALHPRGEPAAALAPSRPLTAPHHRRPPVALTRRPHAHPAESQRARSGLSRGHARETLRKSGTR
jgi:hypothetical protein